MRRGHAFLLRARHLAPPHWWARAHIYERTRSCETESEGVVAIICCCLRALVLSLSVFDIKTMMGQWAGRGRRAVCRSSVVYIFVMIWALFQKISSRILSFIQRQVFWFFQVFCSLVPFNLMKTSTYWCLVVVFLVVIIWFFTYFLCPFWNGLMTAHKIGTIDQWRGTLFCLSSGVFFHISDLFFFFLWKRRAANWTCNFKKNC